MYVVECALGMRYRGCFCDHLGRVTRETVSCASYNVAMYGGLHITDNDKETP